MFGEYGFYCDGKFFGCASDNQFFIEITKTGETILPNCETAPPYKGAKPSLLISDFSNQDLMLKLIEKTCEELPLPKPKKKKLKEI